MAKGAACAWWGWLVLVVGVLYLVADLSTWNAFGIDHWTAVLVLVGLYAAVCKKM